MKLLIAVVVLLVSAVVAGVLVRRRWRRTGPGGERMIDDGRRMLVRLERDSSGYMKQPWKREIVVSLSGEVELGQRPARRDGADGKRLLKKGQVEPSRLETLLAELSRLDPSEYDPQTLAGLPDSGRSRLVFVKAGEQRAISWPDAPAGAAGRKAVEPLREVEAEIMAIAAEAGVVSAAPKPAAIEVVRGPVRLEMDTSNMEHPQKTVVVVQPSGDITFVRRDGRTKHKNKGRVEPARLQALFAQIEGLDPSRFGEVAGHRGCGWFALFFVRDGETETVRWPSSPCEGGAAVVAPLFGIKAEIMDIAAESIPEERVVTLDKRRFED